MLAELSMLCRNDHPGPDWPLSLLSASAVRLFSLELSSLLQARDELTRLHSDAVGRLLGSMLRTRGVDSLDIEKGILGGQLHDIGKLALRVELLQKKGDLTTVERKGLRLHPSVGARIVWAVTGDEDLVGVAMHHHERFDGRGYPAGLKSLEIPLLARMTAVADTFQALVEDRPYRRGIAPGRALAVVRQVRGTQLCPECVDLMLRTTERHPEILANQRDQSVTGERDL